MRRWIVAALLLLCLPVVGRGQSIRYYPDSTSYTLGKTESGILYRAASANPTLLDGLVSYWPLDEISGVRYDAVGSNDLTDNNTVGAKLRGPEGTVAQLVKANSESLSHAAGIVPSTFSFSMWIKPDSSVWATDTGVLSLDDAGNRGIVFNMFAAGDINVWRVGAGHANSTTTSKAIMNSWNHLVFVEDRANSRLDVYINGVKNALGSDGSATAVANSTLTLGHWFAGAYAQGSMAAVGMWNVPLSDADVLTLMNSYHGLRYADLPAGLQTGLVSWWELDEVSGVRYDSHGSNDLTDNNTVSSETAVPGAMNNAAASFVAANSEKLNRTGVNFGFTDFSISLWAKTPVSAAAYQEYVCKNNTIDFDLRSYDANYVQFNVNGSSAQIQTDTNWHLIVAYYVHSEKKAYLTIDAGVPTAGAAGTGLSETTSELAIGAATSTYNNNGLIDEVAIWDRVLTSDRITELWNAGAGVYYPTFQ